MSTGKLTWQGTVFAVQPRIRLTRSFDQRSHSYLGYALHLQGQIGGQEGEFLIGIGKAAQAKHQFRVGDIVSGRSAPVADPRLEPVDYYKTAGLKLIQREDSDDHAGAVTAGSTLAPMPLSAQTASGAAAWPWR